MNPGIDREQALVLMKEYLPTTAMQAHSLASEAIMRSLATRFNQNSDIWGLAGLLHDLDYNETKDDMLNHTLITEEILRRKGVSENIIDAVKHHNAENLNLQRKDLIHFALTAAETITGMLFAAALVNPEHKIASLTVKSIKKRMKAKEFARSVNRDHIKLCEEIGIPLDEFIQISLDALTELELSGDISFQ